MVSKLHSLAVESFSAFRGLGYRGFGVFGLQVQNQTLNPKPLNL